MFDYQRVCDISIPKLRRSPTNRLRSPKGTPLAESRNEAAALRKADLEIIWIKTHMLHVWYICPQNWVIFRANVGNVSIHGTYGKGNFRILKWFGTAMYHIFGHIFGGYQYCLT